MNVRWDCDIPNVRKKRKSSKPSTSSGKINDITIVVSLWICILMVRLMIQGKGILQLEICSLMISMIGGSQQFILNFRFIINKFRHEHILIGASRINVILMTNRLVYIDHLLCLNNPMTHSYYTGWWF